ncbi:MAG: transcription initiation factor IIB family protein [Halobacteriales archaeon]
MTFTHDSTSDGTDRTTSETTTTAPCPECGSERSIYVEVDAEIICAACGFVRAEGLIDHGPEWRSFGTGDDDRRRVGGPLTERRHDRGLTTMIDWRDRDANDRSLSATKRRQFRRLRTWQQRIRTEGTGERNLQYAFSEIDRMASALDLPENVRETASVLYRRALNDDLIRGRSIEAMATGALYAACRLEELPRSLEEFAAVARIARRSIGRAYRYLSRELDLAIAPTDPVRYVPRFCSALDASAAIEREATRIVEQTTTAGISSGKSPTGFAAAAIYLASILHEQDQPAGVSEAPFTQQEVAEVAGVCTVTLRKRYQDQRRVYLEDDAALSTKAD